jgi:hypothetical protein
MKRAAAIIGPTPPFLRWAIEHPCGLRELDLRDLPGSTFRQLRAIQELDLAVSEKRVFQGVAFHAETQPGHDLMGFFPDEILAAFGGQTEVESHCSGCPANVVDDRGGWSGCFGLVRLSDTKQVQEFDQAVEELGLSEKFDNAFGPAPSKWFGVWPNSPFSSEQMDCLLLVLARLDWESEWVMFRSALERCLEMQLVLHVDFFPAGESDGLRWQLNSHCGYCKMEQVIGKNECKGCGRQTVAPSQKKRRVLGLRPYMQMKFVVGESKCEKLVNDYWKWKSEVDS